MTESWSNELSPESARGRVMATYTAALSLGFAASPALLAYLGSGDHAYLDVDTILAYVLRRADPSPAAVLRAYLRRLPARSYRNSCVYHAADGCSLPRDMRAAICNRFYCRAIVDQYNILTAYEGPVLVVAAGEVAAPSQHMAPHHRLPAEAERILHAAGHVLLAAQRAGRGDERDAGARGERRRPVQRAGAGGGHGHDPG